MAEPKTDALVKSLESLVAEKEAVTSKEKELIEGLNAVLLKMGYKVVATDAVPKRRGRPPGSGAKRRGRPAGTGNGRRRREPGRLPGSSQKTAAKPEAKRRGRPPKAKTKTS